MRGGLVGRGYGYVSYVEHSAHDALLEPQVSYTEELDVFNSAGNDAGFDFQAVLEDAVLRTDLHEPRVKEAGQKRGDADQECYPPRHAAAHKIPYTPNHDAERGQNEVETDEVARGNSFFGDEV